MNTCLDRDKQNLRDYEIKGEEKTSIKSKKKEKSHDSYDTIYEYGKKLYTSTFGRACA